jgi:hypothetical protein
MIRAFDREDRRKAQHYSIKTSTGFKIKRAKVKADKITQEMYAQLKDAKDGRAYKSGLALEDDDEEGGQLPRKKRKVKSVEESHCKHCGTKGHNRRTSKDCLKNPKNANNTLNKTAEGATTTPYTDEMDAIPLQEKADDEEEAVNGEEYCNDVPN